MRVATRVATTKVATMESCNNQVAVATLEHTQELQLLCWEGTCATLFLYTIVSTKGDNLLKMHKNKY
jgi:hypothetical protein